MKLDEIKDGQISKPAYFKLTLKSFKINLLFISLIIHLNFGKSLQAHHRSIR